MFLEICIATVALITWPLALVIYRKHDVMRWLEMRVFRDKTKPTKSPFPPLSLPLRYDHIVKEDAPKDAVSLKLSQQDAPPTKEEK